MAKENRHSAYDLAQMQSLSLDSKITMTKERIKQWYDAFEGGGVYISFSGGKDSTVLKHIVDQMYDDVPAVYCNTGLEYPEIQRFVKDVQSGKYDCFTSNVEIIRPKMMFHEIIKEYGYPIASKELSRKIYYAKRGAEWAKKYIDGTAVDAQGRPSRFRIPDMWKPFLNDDAPYISDRCCYIMKKNPLHKYQSETKRKVMMGTMAQESKVREQAWKRTGCNSFDGDYPHSTPMAFWTENDVLEYIVKYNVPYAPVYGDIVETGKMIQRINGEVPELKTTGCDRTGCMFCMFGCHMHNDQRFVRMKETHPKQYEYCMKSVSEGGLGIKDVIDWTNEHCGTKIKY